MRGDNTRVAAPFVFTALSRWELQGTATLQRTKIEGIKTWGPGVTLGLPFKLREASAAQPWRWVVTPSSTFTFDWAKDGLTGNHGTNFVWSGGGTNLLECRWSPTLVFSGVTQLTFHNTLTADLDFLPPGTDRINQ